MPAELRIVRGPSPTPSSRPEAARRDPSRASLPIRREPSMRRPPAESPLTGRVMLDWTVSFRPLSSRRTMLAITVLPCMSMPGAPPRITSMRSTWPAGMRLMISSRGSPLEAGRAPSISTLPAAPPKPRTLSPLSKLNPGSRFTMSSAVVGLLAAKQARL